MTLDCDRYEFPNITPTSPSMSDKRSRSRHASCLQATRRAPVPGVASARSTRDWLLALSVSAATQPGQCARPTKAAQLN